MVVVGDKPGRDAVVMTTNETLGTGRSGDGLRRLVDEGVLSESQLDAVRGVLGERPAGSPLLARVRWAEIAGYLGGGLVLTGAVLLVSTSWDRMSETARTVLLGGFAVVLLAAGVVAAGGAAALWTARRREQTARLRVAAVLLALGAGATALTVGVAMPESADSWGVSGAGGAGLLIAAAGYALLPTVFGLVASIGLGLIAVMAGVDALVELDMLPAGLTLFGSGVVVIGLAVARVLRERLVGLGIGAGIALFGAQQMIGRDDTAPWAYLLSFGLGVALLVAYRWVRSWVPVVFGVIGIALAVPEAIWHLTDHAVGGAAIPLIAGLILLVASGIGLRRHRVHTSAHGL